MRTHAVSEDQVVVLSLMGLRVQDQTGLPLELNWKTLMSWLLYNQGMNDPPYPSVFLPNLSPVTAQRVIVV